MNGEKCKVFVYQIFLLVCSQKRLNLMKIMTFIAIDSRLDKIEMNNELSKKKLINLKLINL